MFFIIILEISFFGLQSDVALFAFQEGEDAKEIKEIWSEEGKEREKGEKGEKD
jgi:hypothetical protein